jgi:hypothetical protein
LYIWVGIGILIRFMNVKILLHLHLGVKQRNRYVDVIKLWRFL